MISDAGLFQVIHGLAGKSVILDGIGIFFAQFAIAAFPLFLFGVPRASRRETFVKLMIAIACAFFINTIIGAIFFRSRPFVTFGFEPLISLFLNGKSFPSDHTAIAFAWAAGLWQKNRVLGFWCLLLALAIGVSRIFVGVHYPADIIGGIIVGIACSYIPRAVERYLKG